MKKTIFILSIAFIVILSGCNNNANQVQEQQTSPQQNITNSQEYDSESWKTIIPESCKHFFDGCNDCQRIESSNVAGCTKKGCSKYSKPKCLDLGNNEKNIDNCIDSNDMCTDKPDGTSCSTGIWCDEKGEVCGGESCVGMGLGECQSERCMPT